MLDHGPIEHGHFLDSVLSSVSNHGRRSASADKSGYISVYLKGGSVKAGETFSAVFNVDGEKFTGGRSVSS
jgi:hypothetical protein